MLDAHVRASEFLPDPIRNQPADSTLSSSAGTAAKPAAPQLPMPRVRFLEPDVRIVHPAPFRQAGFSCDGRARLWFSRLQSSFQYFARHRTPIEFQSQHEVHAP
jgi:hypothetical protein